MPPTPGRHAGLTVTGPRPLAAAALELEDRFQQIITYEDPPYLNPADLAPGPGSLPVPRPGSITIEYGENEPVERVLRRAIEAHEGAGNPGWFAIVRSGDRIDVVPRAYLTAAGEVAERTPLLDTVISRAPIRTSGLEFLERLASALYEERGEEVTIGTVPVNLLALDSSTDSDEAMPARRILGARLSRLNRDLSWQLLNEPASRTFVLNIHSMSA